MSSTTPVSTTHTHHGSSDITFSLSAEGLSVTIDTERLHMRSVLQTDVDKYAALYGDSEVMEKFSNGKTRTRDEVATLIDRWVTRWQERDPYSGLAVFKKGTDTFMGHVGLYSTEPGELDVSGIGHQAFWGDRYASEAFAAIVREYIPATVQEGYTLQGRTLERITATARPDNEASVRLLTRIGMTFVRAAPKFGAMRNHYAIDVSMLCKKSGGMEQT